MDPDNEPDRIAEAIYLHSLWHRGPPRSPFHHPQPPPHSPIPAPPTHLLHLPLNPTNFKKKKKKKHNRKKKILPGSDKEWPCDPSSGDPPASSSDWNRAWPKLNSEPLVLSYQELCRASAIQAQSKALKVTTAYFFDSDDDDESEGDCESDDLEERGFFVNLFEEDKELREFYSKNCRNGEFVCLVCGGLGKKLAGKKYKGCLPLVQHSVSIGNTQKRTAHRAFAQAICKVLGWDISDLSSVASEMATSRDNDGLAVIEIVMVEGAAQEVVDEGGKEVLTDATDLGQGEVCDEKDKVEQHVGEETNDSSCIHDTLPVQECSSGGISENNGGSTLLEQKSGTEAVVSKSADAVPVAFVDRETSTLNHNVEPSKDGCIASTDEGENGGSQIDRGASVEIETEIGNNVISTEKIEKSVDVEVLN